MKGNQDCKEDGLGSSRIQCPSCGVTLCATTKRKIKREHTSFDYRVICHVCATPILVAEQVTVLYQIQEDVCYKRKKHNWVDLLAKKDNERFRDMYEKVEKCKDCDQIVTVSKPLEL